MIIFNNICKIFNEGKSNEKIALKNISLTIDDGEFVAITGKSGAGKSTLLNVMACLETPTSGEYVLNGESTSLFSVVKLAEMRNKYFGIVTQFPFFIDNITPIENVVIPLMYDKKNKKERYQRAAAAMQSVGLDFGQKVKTEMLSGGELQRLSIARAIVNNPPVVLADELTGNLDKENTLKIMKILSDINEKGTTVVVVTHDNDIAKECKREIIMSDSTIIADSIL